MKFIVSSSELLKGVLTVQKAIPAKPSEAILECYLLELVGDRLLIMASDGEITMRTEVKVDVCEEEGKAAFPSRQLTELLKELPEQPITINTATENTFECKWSSGESTLPYYSGEDYPESKTVEGDSFTITVPAEILQEGIGSTIYASSDETNRAVMNSIFFDVKPDLTTLVASDLQKLVCYNSTDFKCDDEASFILNKRHAAVLRQTLSKDFGDVTIIFNDRYAEFHFDATIMVCCLVTGKYPDYKTIIPKNNSNIMRISRTELLNTVRRIAVCSPKASNHIKFDISPDTLEISAQDLGYEMAARDTVACHYDGEPMTIGFKSTHLIEILTNLSCDEVILKLADKKRSVLVLPSEEEAAKEKVFGIVMPIMVH